MDWGHYFFYHESRRNKSLAPCSIRSRRCQVDKPCSSFVSFRAGQILERGAGSGARDSAAPPGRPTRRIDPRLSAPYPQGINAAHPPAGKRCARLHYWPSQWVLSGKCLQMDWPSRNKSIIEIALRRLITLPLPLPQPSFRVTVS